MNLITKIDIAKYREVSRGVRDDKINPYIEDAEMIDLMPLLGDVLYNDIKVKLEQWKSSNIGNTDWEYKELLEGGLYDHNGLTYLNPGLKKVLSIYAYGRYVLFGSYTDTAFGFVEKSHQDSKSVGDGHKRNIHKQSQNIAYNYWLEVEKYLNRKSENYDLWMNNNCSPRGASNIRISKID